MRGPTHSVGRREGRETEPWGARVARQRTSVGPVVGSWMAVASVWALSRAPKGLKYGGAPYLASLLRLNGGECLKYRRGGFRNSV